jgi:hypothetical protein
MKRKVVVVSTREGVSFLFDKKYDYKYFFTGEHMTGDKVAEYLDLSGSAVSNSLESGLSKIFIKLKHKTKFSPVEVMLLMVNIFGIESVIECKRFFHLFDSEIKSSVRMNAKFFVFDKENNYEFTHIVDKLCLGGI